MRIDADALQSNRKNTAEFIKLNTLCRKQDGGTALLLLLITGCVHTVPFRDPSGHIVPQNIATMETVTIGGTPQSIWFRGVSRSNPALISCMEGQVPARSAIFHHYNAASNTISRSYIGSSAGPVAHSTPASHRSP